MNTKYFIYGILLLISIGVVSATTLTTDLISYYNMDNPAGVYDSLGLYDATSITNDVFSSSGCLIGGCRAPGTQFIRITTPDLSEHMSLNMWINSINAQTGAIIRQGQPIFYLVGDNHVSAQYGCGYSGSMPIMAINTWHMLTMTTDGMIENKIYFDGIEVGNCTPIVNLQGQWEVYGTGFHIPNFNGYVDEVGIWNKTLSANEITQIYNTGAGLTYPFEEVQPTVTTETPKTGASARTKMLRLQLAQEQAQTENPIVSVWNWIIGLFK